MSRLKFLLSVLFAPMLVGAGYVTSFNTARPPGEFGVQPASGSTGGYTSSPGIPPVTPAATSRPPTRRKYDAEYNTKRQAILNAYKDAMAACQAVANTCHKNAKNAREAALKALDDSYKTV